MSLSSPLPTMFFIFLSAVDSFYSQRGFPRSLSLFFFHQQFHFSVTPSCQANGLCFFERGEEENPVEVTFTPYFPPIDFFS